MILSQLHINSHTQIHSKKVTGIAIVCVHIYEDTEKVVRRSVITDDICYLWEEKWGWSRLIKKLILSMNLKCENKINLLQLVVE